MEKCLKEVKVGKVDTEYERAKRAELVQQYEDSIKRTLHEVPYGIKDTGMTCAYPVNIGEIKSAECKEDDEGIVLLKLFSDAAHISCGVPQGSILSPLLFILNV